MDIDPATIDATLLTCLVWVREGRRRRLVILSSIGDCRLWPRIEILKRIESADRRISER